jgi:hypothetical protein
MNSTHEIEDIDHQITGWANLNICGDTCKIQGISSN